LGLTLLLFGTFLTMPSGALADNLLEADGESGNINEFSAGIVPGIQSTFTSGLNYPDALAFDSSGNLYVANYATGFGDGTIMEFTPPSTNGTYYTQNYFAYRLNGPAALAFDSNSNIYAANFNDGTIEEFTPTCTNGTVFTSFLNYPDALAFDSNSNLYVANLSSSFSDGSIDEFTPPNTNGTVFARGLHGPSALAFDSSGNLYVANFYDGTIEEFMPPSTNGTVFASGLNSPTALAFDSSGNLYVANFSDGTIEEFTPPNTNGTVFASGLNFPAALAFAPQVRFNYTTNNGTITITSITGTGGLVTIPSTINGLPVTSIGDGAFAYSSISSIVIPNSVTNIGDQAFFFCVNLQVIYFQGNAPAMGEGVFDQVTYFNDKATIYYLPGSTGWGSTFGGLPTALWYLSNPLILNSEPNIGTQTNGFGFNIYWASNISVVVEACTNLSNPIWVPILTNTPTSGSSYFSDPQWTNYPGRFYRVSSPPLPMPPF